MTLVLWDESMLGYNLGDHPLDPVRLEVFYDAQTSGGMLISLPAAHAEAAVARARERGAAATCVIGEVIERRDKAIILKP